MYLILLILRRIACGELWMLIYACISRNITPHSSALVSCDVGPWDGGNMAVVVWQHHYEWLGSCMLALQGSGISGYTSKLLFFKSLMIELFILKIILKLVCYLLIWLLTYRDDVSRILRIRWDRPCRIVGVRGHSLIIWSRW